MYLGVGRCGRRRFVEYNSVGIFWYLRPITRRNSGNITGGILDLFPMGIREIIPEGITGEKTSCGGLVVSIPDGIFKKESVGKYLRFYSPI